MKTRILTLFFAVALAVSFDAPARAEVVGSWDVEGLMKIKVTIKGYGVKHSESSREEVFQTLVFGDAPEYLFSTEGFESSWGYEGKKAVVYLDEDELKAYFEAEITALLESEGYEAEVENITILNSRLYVKERKDGTIKGKWNLVFSCLLNLPEEILYDLDVKMSMKTRFTGTRSPDTPHLEPLRAVAGLESGGVTAPEAVVEKIVEQVSRFSVRE